MIGPIQVLIVEDDPSLRFVFAAMLADDRRLQVSGSCATAAEALAHLSAHLVDCVLIDVGLPDRDGITVTSEICARVGAPKVIVLSGRERDVVWNRAEKAGASEFVRKGRIGPELAELIVSVCANSIA